MEQNTPLRLECPKYPAFLYQSSLSGHGHCHMAIEFPVTWSAQHCTYGCWYSCNSYLILYSCIRFMAQVVKDLYKSHKHGGNISALTTKLNPALIFLLIFCDFSCRSYLRKSKITHSDSTQRTNWNGIWFYRRWQLL